MDLFNDARLHRGFQHWPLFGGCRHKQLVPWLRSLRFHRGRSPSSGLDGRRLDVHTMGRDPGPV